MPSAKELRAAMKRQTRRTPLTSEDLAVKRIAARECGLILYSQEVRVPGGTERIHILSRPHEVPRRDMSTPDGDPEWFSLPESEMRRIKRVASDMLSGVRIRTDENGRLVSEAVR